MCRLSHVLQAHGVSLLWSISEDTHTLRRVTMMATLGGYLFTLISRRPLGLQGARGGPRAARGWTAGAGDAVHVAAPELPRAGQRELEPQNAWWPRSCPGLYSSCWGYGHAGTCDLHASPFVLTWNLYAGYLVFRVSIKTSICLMIFYQKEKRPRKNQVLCLVISRISIKKNCSILYLRIVRDH
jgi:hypothetical protein